MKKSLILSVVMTLVLVISMSTATYAWYTTNDKVTATVSTVKAATSSGNLRITKDEATDGWTTEVTNTVDKALMPTCPSAKFDETNLPSGTLWLTGTQDNKGSVTLGEPSASSQVITGTWKLYNDAQQPTGKITLDVTSTGDFPNALTNEEYEYVITDENGTVLWGTTYNYGNLENNKEGTATAVQTGISSLGPNSQIELKFYIWLDGWDVNNTDQGKSVNLQFKFTAAAA